MKTIEELKQDVINALGEVDLTKLSLLDMGNYVNTLKAASEIIPKSYGEQLSDMMKSMANGFGSRYEPKTIGDLKKDNDTFPVMGSSR